MIQSKIAVGSGMIWGKGFLQGTQNHLDFLPEQHTDFIFSVFAEEWGFVGASALLGLYLMLLLRMVVIAARTRDRFGVLLTLAIGTIFFWQVTVNVGMTTGVLPVVGIPLPALQLRRLVAVRNRSRSASRELRWRWPGCCALPCCESPSDRAWRTAPADRLRYRAGSRERSVVQTPSTGIDPNK